MSNLHNQLCGLPEHVLQVARGEGPPPAPGGCYIKPLPQRLHESAVQTAAAVCPSNSPKPHSPLDAFIDPWQAAGTRYWGPEPRTLTITFLEDPSHALQQKVIHHMNAWDCNVSFALATSKQAAADLRITLADSASTWSYLGTETLLVPDDMPTMALPGVNMDMPEQELRRRVVHVAGHVLGFHHQSFASRAVIQNIIPERAYAWFRQTQGWNPSTVDKLLLQASNTASQANTGSAEAAAGGGGEASVMAFWLPATIMNNQLEAMGALDITAADHTMCRSIYQAGDR